MRTTARLTRATLSLLLAASLPALAAGDRACSLSDDQFVVAVASLRDWQAIHAFHRRHFPSCPDDGLYAEGYSELVVRMLAGSWVALPQLAEAVRSDAGFKAFVLRHIDATTNEADLLRIGNAAVERCPVELESLCAEIGRAAERAIRELR